MSTCGCYRTQRHTRAELTFLLLLLHRLFLFIYLVFFCPGHLLKSCAQDKLLLALLDPTNHIMNQKKKERRGKKEREAATIFCDLYQRVPQFLWLLMRIASPRLPTNVDRHSYIKKKHNRTQFLESGLWGYLIIMSKAGWAPADQQQQQQLTIFLKKAKRWIRWTHCVFVCFVGFYDFLFFFFLAMAFNFPSSCCCTSLFNTRKNIIKVSFRWETTLERERERLGGMRQQAAEVLPSVKSKRIFKDNPHFFDDSDHSLQIDDKCLGFFSFACQLLRQQVAYDLYTILPLSCCLLRLRLRLLLILCML